ncbi:MAG: hypothetical protein A2020_02525 [Lentisphaerae bacterium GWF2_45_14]|nr:MAG: hypothetical protein A2020_02525 [Lentisphaerae bacterium GWF2_45_14]
MKKISLKKIIVIGLSLILLPSAGAPVLYLFATSSFFIRTTVLPIASKYAGFRISATEINISLLKSSISASGVEAGPESTPFLKVSKLNASWGLREIMAGNIKINKLHIEDAELSINKETLAALCPPPKGRDAPTTMQTAGKQEESAAAALKLKIDIKDISAERLNVAIRLDNLDLTVKNAVLALPSLKTGEDAELSISGEVSVKSGTDINISRCILKNRMRFSINEELKPAYIDYVLEIDEFSGNIKDIKLQDRNVAISLKSKFDNSLNSSTIEEFYIKETAGGKTISSAELSGNIAFSPLKLDLGIEVTKISPEVIYAFSNGFDIGTPVPSLRAKLFYGEGRLKSAGNISVKSLKFGRENVPDVDIETGFDVSADINKKSAGISKLSLIALEGARKLISVNLSKPSTVSWVGGKFKIEGDSPEIKATISALDIATVNSFLPPDALPVTEGIFSADITGGLLQDMNRISVRTVIRAYNLRFKGFGTGLYSVENEAEMEMKNSETLELKNFNLRLSSGTGKENIAAAKLNGNYRIATGNIELNIEAGTSPEALELMPESIKKQKFIRLLDGMSTRLNTSAASNLKDKELSLKKIDFQLLKNAKSLAKVNTVETINYNWGRSVSGLKDFPFKAMIAINGYPLDRINIFMPESGAFKFLSGTASSSIEVLNSGTELAVKGAIAAKELAFSVGKENYRKMALVYRTDSRMPLDFEGITLNDDSLEISSGKDRAAEMKFKGPLVFNDFAMNIEVLIAELNNGILNVLPEKMSVATQLKRFVVSGESRVSIDSKEKSFGAKGALRARKVVTKLPMLAQDKELNSDIAFDLTKNNTQTELKDFSISAFNNAKQELFNFSGNCNLRNENGITGADIKLLSENIDLELVRNHMATAQSSDKPQAENVKKAKKKSPWKKSTDFVESVLQVATDTLRGIAAPVAKRKEPEMISANLDSTEPAAVDLKWLRLMANIELKKISWTKNVTASLNSEITARENVIRAEPLLIKINSTPLNCKMMLNPGQSDGYPFELSADMKNLDLSPIFKAAFKNGLSESKGKIDSMLTAASGKGFSPANLQNKMKASFKMETSDILIRNDLEEYYVFQIMFLPLEVFADMKSFLPKNSYSSEVANSISKTKESLKNIRFSRGSINIVSDRKIYVKQCEFRGDFIKNLKLEGAAGFNQNLFLTSTLNVGTITMPMDINGTLSDPDPDINKMLPEFLRQNAQNIINSQKEVKETIKKLGNELQKELMRIKFR